MQTTDSLARALSRAASPRPVAILAACVVLVGTAAGFTAKATEGRLPVCVGPDRVVHWAPTGCGSGGKAHLLVTETLDPPQKEEEKALEARIEEMKRQVEFLRQRVANLEAESRNRESDNVPTQVKAPFEVVDGSGNPIFVVANALHGAVARKGRVQIARAVGDGFSMVVSNGSGSTVVGFGDGGDAADGGLVYVADQAGRSRVHASAAGLKLFSTGDGRAAPFEVFDKQGNRAFVVTDQPFATATAGRVQIGVGSASNYGLYLRRSSGQLAAAIAEGNDGNGVVIANDATGKPRAELYGGRGVAVYNNAGKSSITLERTPDGAYGLVHITGIMQFLSDQGGALVDIGATSKRCAGLVRTHPVDNRGAALGVPGSVLMGKC